QLLATLQQMLKADGTFKGAQVEESGARASRGEIEVPSPTLVLVEQGLQTMPGLASMDVEEAAIGIRSEPSRDSEAELRDILNEMQQLDARKKAQRELINQMKQEKTAAAAQMHNEYQQAVSNGQISDKVTFDQYSQWRQVSWGDDGSVGLGPMPEIPSW